VPANVPVRISTLAPRWWMPRTILSTSLTERPRLWSFPDDEDVALAQVVERGGDAWAVYLAGVGLLLEDTAAAGFGERVVLKLGVMGVNGDAG
jgi:hypothetical protein